MLQRENETPLAQNAGIRNCWIQVGRRIHQDRPGRLESTQRRLSEFFIVLRKRTDLILRSGETFAENPTASRASLDRQEMVGGWLFQSYNIIVERGAMVPIAEGVSAWSPLLWGRGNL